jgi:hypothetical protein
VFTPGDSSGYTASHGSVSLKVNKAIPVIEWPAPDPIGYGAALGARQLNAKVGVTGSLAYTPALSETLSPGVHELSVVFTPKDQLNYTTARAAVALNVTEKMPVQIHWPTPQQIGYGNALNSAQLNATASVAGTFAYTPSAGHILAPGRYTLTATFTPAEADKYATGEATVELEVEGAAETAAAPAQAEEAPYTWSFDTGNGAPPEPPQAETKAAAPGAEEEGFEAPAPAPPAADTESEWSFLTITSPHGDSAVQTEIKHVQESTPHVDLPPAAEEETPYEWTFDTTSASQSSEASPKAKAERNGNGTKPHETRKFKGAIYEKGDDGQWHLQKK